MIKEVKLSSKGQVTVPKAVRERLGVDNGDTIAFYFDDNAVKLTGTENLKFLSKDKKKTGTVQKRNK